MAAVLIGLSRAGAPDAETAVSGATRALADGTSLGSPDAPVVITMFSEYQCSVCQRFYATTEQELRKAYVDTGKVRLVFKHFVMFGNESMQAALASEAAAEQNKFWDYHDLLMATGASAKTEGDLTTAKLQRLAEQAGLDMGAFNASFLSGRYADKVEKDFDEGMGLGLRGTPTFFVNGERVDGYRPFAFFQQLINRLLEETATAE